MKRVLFMLAFVFWLAQSLQAAAYDFSPIIAQFEPNGTGSARNFTVRNTQQEPIAIQIEVFARSADDMGNETREPDFDSFILAPPQLVLAPGASQTIRARWVGEPELASEQAFRIVVRQLPIQFRGEEATGEVAATVSVGYTYEVAAYVAPRNARPAAALVASERHQAEDGTQHLRITLRNDGAARAILDNPRLRVTALGGETIELADDRLEPLQLKNILSGTQTVIDLPWPSEIPFSDVNVEFETRYLTR